METFLLAFLTIWFVDSQLQPPPIVVPPIEEGIKTQEVREVPKDAVNVSEVMALKEVLEKVVDLQKREEEQ